MLTATCQNCGQPKQPSEYANNTCDGCADARKEAETNFQKSNPNATESQILYEGRRALLHRAHSAHKNFTDPRAFSGVRGMIPIPPTGGDRGTPA